MGAVLCLLQNVINRVRWIVQYQTLMQMQLTFVLSVVQNSSVPISAVMMLTKQQVVGTPALKGLRCAKNAIRGFVDEGWTWRSDKDGMVDMMISYFSSLFSSAMSSEDQIEKVTRSVNLRLSDRSRVLLDRLFIAEEVKIAIIEMSPTKALGVDGLPALFYHKYWD
ncbi:hypothetical protein QYF36_005534 [Acer negundo]|nr:hypothetical protein QYF36_005534 [Acer negundo]